MPSTGTVTRHSLILRVRNTGDESAWVEFDRIYRQFIAFTLNHIGVEGVDIDDLTQQVMLMLTRDLSGYDRGKARFRTWLSSVIRHAALAHLQRNRSEPARPGQPGSDSVLAVLQSSASDLDERIEAEWRTYVASLAMERVRGQFHGKAMEVFELGLDGVALEDICRRTGLTAASAYTLRKRVKKRLHCEILALIEELES